MDFGRLDIGGNRIYIFRKTMRQIMYIILYLLLLSFTAANVSAAFTAKDSHAQGNDDYSMNGAFGIATNFIAGSAYNLTKIQWNGLSKVGNPGCILTAYIYSYEADTIGVRLGKSNTTLNCNTEITGSFANYNFTFNWTQQVNLTNGVIYVLVLNDTVGAIQGVGNVVTWHHDTSESGREISYFTDQWNDVGNRQGDFITYSGGIEKPADENPMLTINLTIDTPVNGSFFGLEQIVANSSNLWINLTQNATGEYSITLNDTRFSLSSNTSTQRYYLNNTALSTGLYYISINLSQYNSTNASDTVTFFVDLISPVITPLTILENNRTYVWNGTLSTQINFSDDHEIYSINITLGNATVLYNATNLGVSSYSRNISYGVDTTPINSITARVCDSHTTNSVRDLEYKLTKDGIRYVMSTWLWIDQEWIEIYPKASLTAYRATTARLTDRYAFTLPRATTYVVESNSFIDIPARQLYPGHLVIPGIDNGYWVDFNNAEVKGIEIKRISPTKVEVTINGLVSDSIAFNSIGELNCLTETYWYNNLNPTVGYDVNITAGSTGTFSLNITDNHNITVSHNATLIYNNSIYYAGVTSNFSVSYTAPSFYGLNTPKYVNWILIINNNTHNISMNTQYIYNKFLDNCSNSSFFKVATINFLRVDDGTFINLSATLSLTGDANYNTAYEDNQSELCIYPNNINISENFNIHFGTDISTQQYINVFNFSNATHTIINLYYQSSTDTTIFTIKNKDTAELLKDVFSTMYRFMGGSWTVIESKYSDITGKVQFSYTDGIGYRFLLTKDGFAPYSFDLDPILFSSYDVLMEPDISWNVSQDYEKLAIYYYPTAYYDGEINNFTFMLHSPYGELSEYGYTLSYPGGSTSESGMTNVGEILESNFTITGATEYDRVRIDYYYYTNLSGYRNFTYFYSIIVGNMTMISNKEQTYGLGLLERILVSVFVGIFVVGIATLIGQPVAGMGLGLLIMGYLSFIGFMPIWSFLLPGTLGLIFVGSRPGG